MNCATTMRHKPPNRANVLRTACRRCRVGKTDTAGRVPTEERDERRDEGVSVRR